MKNLNFFWENPGTTNRNTRTSAPLVKVNSTYMKHIKSDRVNLVAPASPVHRAGDNTNCDRKGWHFKSSLSCIKLLQRNHSWKLWISTRKTRIYSQFSLGSGFEGYYRKSDIFKNGGLLEISQTVLYLWRFWNIF